MHVRGTSLIAGMIIVLAAVLTGYFGYQSASASVDASLVAYGQVVEDARNQVKDPFDLEGAFYLEAKESLYASSQAMAPAEKYTVAFYYTLAGALGGFILALLVSHPLAYALSFSARRNRRARMRQIYAHY